MSLVLSMKAIGRVEGERDIELMFKSQAPFKINSGSGAFRIFIKTLKKFEEGFQYDGTVSDCDVSGFYNPATQSGTIVFMSKAPSIASR